MPIDQAHYNWYLQTNDYFLSQQSVVIDPLVTAARQRAEQLRLESAAQFEQSRNAQITREQERVTHAREMRELLTNYIFGLVLVFKRQRNFKRYRELTRILAETSFFETTPNEWLGSDYNYVSLRNFFRKVSEQRHYDSRRKPNARRRTARYVGKVSSISYYACCAPHMLGLADFQSLENHAQNLLFTSDNR
jgi:hypothetical protein